MYTGKGEGRVWPGAFIYCFSDVKMHARGRGAEYLTTWPYILYGWPLGAVWVISHMAIIQILKMQIDNSQEKLLETIIWKRHSKSTNGIFQLETVAIFCC